MEQGRKGGSGGRGRPRRLKSQGSRGTTLSIDDWGSSSATQEESVHPRDLLGARVEELETQLRENIKTCRNIGEK
ncbi:hypothetical protein JTE90_028570 [Oedothorax gibbosus]|uniref:Uncharacterized protein n=1 Tax=Oedothorax gibbosus TaxID=931172 RepID=A0AAV6VW90_9ARAC|nr:hypothetical protein JTE90_028570 [Oedothorax gibbosus]